MIYRATRLSRSEGFQWEKDTPLAYQRCSDILMGCQCSDKPYYVICGHVPLRVTISEGTRVDSRENRLYTAEEVTVREDAAAGLSLMWSIVRRPAGDGVVQFMSGSSFEQALCYAAKHLPRARTAHTIISENVPEFGTTVLLSLEKEQQADRSPAWMQQLPDFSQHASGVAMPDVPFDEVYDSMLAANSRNHDLRMLEFLAFACGAEPDRTNLDEYAKYLRQISPDAQLVSRFFGYIKPEEFDVPTMLPVLYSISGKEGDKIVAANVRRYLTTEKLRSVERSRPPVKKGSIVSAFAEHFDAGKTFSLESATVPELFEVYQYIRERGLTSKDLHSFLAEDDNSDSMYELILSGERDLRDKRIKVQGLMPAVLYWYDEINRDECVRLYGNEQTADRMIAQAKLLAMPKRMQKLEFRDDFYKQEPPKTRLRDVQNLPKLILSSLLAVLVLLGTGGAAGYALGRSKVPAERPAESSSVPDQTVPEQTTSAPETTTQPQVSVLRTQRCRMDEAAQNAVRACLNANADTLPTGCAPEDGIVYYAVASAELASFSADALPQAHYMVPFQDGTAGVVTFTAQADGTAEYEQTFYASAADGRPAEWFELPVIERDLGTLTAEPSAILLLFCTDGPYAKLVYTVSGGAAYVTPYQLRAEGLDTRTPLTEGKLTSLDSYLTWLSGAPAETTTTAASTTVT